MSFLNKPFLFLRSLLTLFHLKFVQKAKILLLQVYEVNLKVYCNVDESYSPNQNCKEYIFSPLLFRTPDPLIPPTVCIQSYTSSQIFVTWDKPWLYTPGGAHHEIVSFNVMVNGSSYAKLSSSAQACFLTKCRPGRTYSIMVVVVSKAAQTNKTSGANSSNNVSFSVIDLWAGFDNNQ